MQGFNWALFHDGQLEAVVVDWPSGAVRISVKAERPLEIEAAGFVDIAIPRRLPWGMSQSINTARCRRNSPHTWAFEMEFQSGDALRVEAYQIRAKS